MILGSGTSFLLFDEPTVRITGGFAAPQLDRDAWNNSEIGQSWLEELKDYPGPALAVIKGSLSTGKIYIAG